MSPTSYLAALPRVKSTTGECSNPPLGGVNASLAVGAQDGTLRVWDVPGSRLLQTLVGQAEGQAQWVNDAVGRARVPSPRLAANSPCGSGTRRRPAAGGLHGHTGSTPRRAARRHRRPARRHRRRQTAPSSGWTRSLSLLADLSLGPCHSEGLRLDGSRGIRDLARDCGSYTLFVGPTRRERLADPQVARRPTRDLRPGEGARGEHQ